MPRLAWDDLMMLIPSCSRAFSNMRLSSVPLRGPCPDLELVDRMSWFFSVDPSHLLLLSARFPCWFAGFVLVRVDFPGSAIPPAYCSVFLTCPKRVDLLTFCFPFSVQISSRSQKANLSFPGPNWASELPLASVTGVHCRLKGGLRMGAD